MPPQRLNVTLISLLYLISITALSVSDGSVTGWENDTLILPCTYTVHKENHRLCWGRGSCTVLWCNNVILETDGSTVTWRKSDRYQLLGDITQGDVSLTITEVTKEDEGTYCCRVDIPGLFNDRKMEMKVQIETTGVSAQVTHTDNETQFTTIDTSSTISYSFTTPVMGTASTPSQNTEIATAANPSIYTIATAATWAGALVLFLMLFTVILYRRRSYEKEKEIASSTGSVINMEVLKAAGSHAVENIYS